MDIIETDIPAIKLLAPQRHEDARGWLMETWSQRSLAAANLSGDWVQENLVFSRAAGTLRGLHYQAPPAAQAKLIQVLRGAVYDVAVDIRRGSPHYGRHVGVKLDHRSGIQLWAPVGFAHGYLTLEPDTEVLYLVSAPYAPHLERGIRWDDPALRIEWPITNELVMVERDRHLPNLAESPSDFSYRGSP